MIIIRSYSGVQNNSSGVETGGVLENDYIIINPVSSISGDVQLTGGRPSSVIGVVLDPNTGYGRVTPSEIPTLNP